MSSKKNYPYRIKTEDAVAIVDGWLTTHPNPFWHWTPEQFKTELRVRSDDGTILLSVAHAIIEKASTAKMHGLANRGFGFFKQEWKKIRF